MSGISQSHQVNSGTILSLSNEDKSRAEAYKGNVRRQELERSAASFEEFLQSLEMVAEISSFNEPNLPRIVQLINKTNQFNLTTRRYTESQVREFMASSNYETLYVKLRDRFGDNGLIAVLIAKVCNGALDIDTWLMSCRVIGRKVEELMMLVLVDRAIDRGLNRIVGHYYPTEKNALVNQLFVDLGFQQLSHDGNGNTDWILDLNKNPESIPFYPARTYFKIC